MADYTLSIMGVFKDMATGELKKLGEAFTGVGRSSEGAQRKTSNFGDKMVTLSAKLTTLKQGAEQVGQMFQKAFDFAELGAESIQTARGFDNITKSVGATEGLLGRLQMAADGTISDMQLMSSTSTLLAGTQGQLGTALANATPKLLEIAKAANALNPTLGDTTFLYDSLALGIKRASPMILDNLGLTIKIGDANEKYAKQIGKTVQELTAEDQKIALLNATVEAGNVLMAQAGENVNSATDEFARFKVNIQNSKTALAEMASVKLTPILAQINDLMSISEKEQVVIDKAREVADLAGGSAREYATAMRESMIQQAIEAGETEKNMRKRIAVTENGNIAILGFYGQMLEARRQNVAEQIRENEALGKDTTKLVARYEELSQKVEEHAATLIELETPAQEEHRKAVEAGAAAQEEWSVQAFRTGEAARQMARDVYEAEEAERAIQEAAEEAAASQEKLREKFSQLSDSMQTDVTDALDDYTEEVSDVMGDFVEIRGEFEKMRAEEGFPTAEQLVQLQQWSTHLGAIPNILQSVADEHKKAMGQIIFDMAMARLETDGFTDAEYRLASGIAESLGLINEEQSKAMLNVGQIIQRFDIMGDVEGAIRQVGTLSSSFIDSQQYVEGNSRVVNDLKGDIDELLISAEAMPGTTEQAIGGMTELSSTAITGMYEMYDATVSTMQEQAGEASTDIDTVHQSLTDMTDEEYPIDLSIAEWDPLREAFGYLESTTKFLQGTHQINFAVTQTGEFPSGSLPQYQNGGMVGQTGIALVHAGELIIPARDVNTTTTGGGGTQITYGATNNFNLSVMSTQDVRSIMQEFEIMQAMAG